MKDRLTISDLVNARQNGQKVAAVSCYDYTTARIAASAGVEMILVGDSAAQVILGHDSTLPATMDFMVTITAAVRRGAPRACLIADMPFLSYHTGWAEAVKNAGRFVRQADVQLVKIESTAAQLDVIKAVSDAGIGVMAHIGIRPQSITKLGKLKAEGTTAEMALDLICLAKTMIDAGASTLLLEGVAREIARIITKRSSVPVIGCGSGPDCDGQILIVSDLLGLGEGKIPKFSKNYAQLNQQARQAFADYAQQVRQGSFPNDQHSYHIKPGQLEQLEKMLDNRA